MTDPGPDSLARHLAWNKVGGCTCPHKWKGLGILYGVSMGKGWVRMGDDPGCRHHGEEVT